LMVRRVLFAVVEGHRTPFSALRFRACISTKGPRRRLLVRLSGLRSGPHRRNRSRAVKVAAVPSSSQR
jgi:hypothetical protein